MRPFALALVLTVTTSIAACGDNLATPDAAGDDTPAPDAPPAGARAVIVSGDFAATGVLSTLDLPERTMHQGAVAGIAGVDPVIRQFGDELHVVNRAGGSNVTIIDVHTLALIDQIGTGANTNPQDVAQVGTKLYVVDFAATTVSVFDRAAGHARTEIDVADLDGVDGHPDCVSVFAVGTRVYVACDQLDDTYTPRGPGQITVIDTATDTRIATFDLAASRPFSLFARTPTTSVYGGDLVIGTAPSFTDVSTGCLARISVGATPAANGCVKTNQELGGYANHVEASPDGALLYLAVDGFTPTFESFGALRGLDLSSGDLWSDPLSAADQVIIDLATCPGGLVVAADGGAAKGVRVYDNGTEVTTAPMPFGLPPAFGGNLVCFSR